MLIMWWCLSRSLQYINRDCSEEFYTLAAHPDTMLKKVTVFRCSSTFANLSHSGQDGTSLHELVEIRNSLIQGGHISWGVLELNC